MNGRAPLPDLADLVEPRPGQVDVNEWADACGRRHVLILAGLRPYPFTEFAARRRKTGQPYAEWQEATRTALKAALRRSGTAPYPRTAVLGLAMAFGARRDVMPGQRRATAVGSFDLRNLEKALEDVAKGVLWHDDKQVRYSGPGSARDSEADWFALHVWDGDVGWRSEWAGFSVPEVEVVNE